MDHVLKICYQLSSAAYHPGFIDGPTWVQVDNSTAVVWNRPEAVYVGFAGTDPTCVRDVFDDLKFRMVPETEGRAHRGFVRTWMPSGATSSITSTCRARSWCSQATR